MMKETDDGVAGGQARRFWTRRRVLTVGAAGLLASAIAAPIVWASRLGGHFGRHGFGHGRFLADPEAAKAKAEFAVEWAFRSVGASEDQQSQARTIVDRAVDDLVPLVQQHRVNHDDWAAALSGAQVDRAALEKLRRSHLSAADEASKRVLQGVADLADILTPEQRTELRGLAQRFHGLHHGEGEQRP